MSTIRSVVGFHLNENMDSDVKSEVYPAGKLSWHDLNDGYQALPEERKQTRYGDGDFWDD